MRIHRLSLSRRAISTALAIAIVPALLISAPPPQARAETHEVRWRRGEHPDDHAARHRGHPRSMRQVKKRAIACACGRRVHGWHPTWCQAADHVHVYKQHPFFFHGGFGLYFGGAVLDVDIASTPPHGYRYIDPVCHRSFSSVTQYRIHLRRHRHPGFLEVAPIDTWATCR